MSDASSVSEGTGYTGDLSVNEAWTLLSSDPAAVLIDVRTAAEWAWVGVPVLESLNKTLLTVEWVSFPGNAKNDAFSDQVHDQVQALSGTYDAPLLMLCRSGVRSKGAAKVMMEAGYKRCYNISGGFEGDLNEQKHRGNTGGWKVADLPWAQK
jgi:rhodanese-related sulfurtransferase